MGIMLIISNCLTETADEGCVKVACSLIKRLKRAEPNHFIVSYERRSDLSNWHLYCNRFLLSRKLFGIIKNRKEKVLYLPFPARPIATAVRVFVLSLFSKAGLDVLITMQSPMGALSRMLIKQSKAHFLLLSKESYDRFKDTLGSQRVTYIKTGVDTKKFIPVSFRTARELKMKYHFDPERPVVLHVGHLNAGRNIGTLLKIDPKYQICLVVSTLTGQERDGALHRQLLSRANIRIMDSYIPEIEEIYQMADVYYFPVAEYGKCIDVPLSCLEAAACNKPVITTRYGEMRAFEGKAGFVFIDSFDESSINSAVDEALQINPVQTRDSVLEYDFDHAVSYYLK